MSTKGFTWRGTPDPTTWQWQYEKAAPGYLVINDHHGIAIADVYAGKYARVYAHSLALGQVESFRPGGDEGLVYFAECSSWEHGVKLVEDFLEAVPVWGTRDDIRWCGLFESVTAVMVANSDR